MEFDITDILKFYVSIMDSEKPSSDEGILNYTTENYNFDFGDIESQTVLLINNFLLVYNEIINDLKEITERVKHIDGKMDGLVSEDYEFRKLKYFKNRNIEAKTEIEDFLMCDVAKHVKKRVVDEKGRTEFSTGLGKTFNGLPYRYSYYKRYYDPQYDFSTESKFRFLLGHKHGAIDAKIETKKTNPTKYFRDIDRILGTGELLKDIISKIEGHHRLKNRIEIFKTLHELYKNGLYQSFINLAVIQIEGLFYDFCVIINDEQETDNMGTLGEKAEKIFKSNLVLWLSIYPYFAFEVPTFRNKVAHKGLWNGNNLKNFANELILDLYTILEMIRLPYIPPNNLLILFTSIRQQIPHIEFTEEDYETVLSEMFTAVQFEKSCSKSIFALLKEREDRRELFEHYIIPVGDGTNTNLYEECNRLVEAIHNEKFWNIVLACMKKVEVHNPGKRYDFIDFVKLITDNCIGELKSDTPAKSKCIEVKRELERFGD